MASDKANRKIVPKSWPTAADYQGAMQNLSVSMSDNELRGGTAALNRLEMPLVYAGAVADVYRVDCQSEGNSWAVKCFKRPTIGLRQRYAKISDCLDQKRLKFMVDFQYLEQGIRVGVNWYPIVKMRWIEGLTLNEFVGKTLDQPNMLDQLVLLWVKLSEQLRQAGIAHADLQHGNVMLVPKEADDTVLLKLIDYDGMWVPSLAGSHSGESGHCNFQHPQRLSEDVYSAEVDRFSHLCICCALRCLSVGGRSLWNRFNTDDNLLFTAKDFMAPSESLLLRELWTLRDSIAHMLVGHLVLATQQPLEQVALVEKLIKDGKAARLGREQSLQVHALLHGDIPASSMVPVAAESNPKASTLPATVDDSVPAVEPHTAKLVTISDQTEVSSATTTQPVEAATLSLPWVFAGAAFFLVAAVAIGWFVMRNWDSRGRSTEYEGSIAASSRPEMEALSKRLEASIAQQDLSTARSIVRQIEALSTNTLQLAYWKSQIDYLKAVPPGTRDAFTNSIGMKFRWIPMKKSGGDASDHTTFAAYLGAHEVTQQQYDAVMGENPSRFVGPGLPVDSVSALQASEFCRLLTEMERSSRGLPDGMGYRLPTESEWFYGARGGIENTWFFAPIENYPRQARRSILRIKGSELERYAWLPYGSDSQTHPVGQKLPNPWGLYDMFGNVSEWVLLSESPESPTWWRFGSLGGGWYYDISYTTTFMDETSYRQHPEREIGGVYAHASLGFRVALAKQSRVTESITNSIDMPLVKIFAGEFEMGSNSNNAKPKHRVLLLHDFYIGVTEVSQRQYYLVTGQRPSRIKRDQLPVDQVSAHDADEFCRLLTERERTGGTLPHAKYYRLPTEAEWEYAARAGSHSQWYCGHSSELEYFEWFREIRNHAQVRSRTHPVATKPPNPWGLHDVLGNVSEWVLDDYHDYGARIKDSPTVDPYVRGTVSSTNADFFRIVRGSDARYRPDAIGSVGLLSSTSKREPRSPQDSNNEFTGFRVVLADAQSTPLEFVTQQFESALANGDPDSANDLLTNIERLAPKDSRLIEWKKEVDQLKELV